MSHPLLRSIAEDFPNGARTFATRCDALWENGRLIHEMGRIKSFVDLLMAVESVLRAHALPSFKDKPVEGVYLAVRRSGHDLRKLASLPTNVPDHIVYERLADSLAECTSGIHLRLTKPSCRRGPVRTMPS
ncbi:hypothetical protein [Variovorax atrisoli]|uniref:hypothetical protein n=1 Tax=Variovorax atrisoli TaxID=3394203 RepID=UPI00403FF238